MCKVITVSSAPRSRKNSAVLRGASRTEGMPEHHKRAGPFKRTTPEGGEEETRPDIICKTQGPAHHAEKNSIPTVTGPADYQIRQTKRHTHSITSLCRKNIRNRQITRQGWPGFVASSGRFMGPVPLLFPAFAFIPPEF